jgi:hypothetical protein
MNKRGINWGAMGAGAGSLSKKFPYLVALIGIIILETLGVYGTYLLLWISTTALGVFGFIFLFSRRGLNVFILGVIPLFLALVSIPYLNIVFDYIPFINLFTPGSFNLRYFLILGLTLYFWFFGMRYEGGVAQYKGMGNRAGTAATKGVGRGAVYGAKGVGAGVRFGWKNFSLGRILVWLGIIVVFYFLETSSIVDLFGPLVVSAILGLFGIAMFFWKGFTFKVLGLLSVVLAMGGIISLFPIPFIELIFNNNVMEQTYPGEWFRYGFIAVIVFYIMFKEKGWAQERVI